MSPCLFCFLFFLGGDGRWGGGGGFLFFVGFFFWGGGGCFGVFLHQNIQSGYSLRQFYCIPTFSMEK